MLALPDDLKHYIDPDDFNRVIYHQRSTGTDERMKQLLSDACQNRPLLKMKTAKRSDIKRLLYVPLEEIPDGQKRREIEYYLKGQTELEQVLKLVSDFKILLSGKDETELNSWIKRAEILQITEINSFLKLIRSDLEAVKNAIKYDYSNSPAEGYNN